MNGKKLALTRPFWILSFALSISSCATPSLSSRFNPTQLLDAICAQGGSPTAVTGSVWANVQSPEMKGQFPATFRAEKGGNLVLEITDLIGTPQAWLRMEKGKPPEIRLSDANQRKAGNAPAQQIWAGLPLEFAPTLFLGKVPCPARSSGQQISASGVKEQDFEVRALETATQTRRVYIYSFQDFGGQPWVERLQYRLEREGKVLSRVDLEFMDPTDPGAYPKRWTATSPQGEIKVRWKDRTLHP